MQYYKNVKQLLFVSVLMCILLQSTIASSQPPPEHPGCEGGSCLSGNWLVYYGVFKPSKGDWEDKDEKRKWFGLGFCGNLMKIAGKKATWGCLDIGGEPFHYGLSFNASVAGPFFVGVGLSSLEVNLKRLGTPIFGIPQWETYTEKRSMYSYRGGLQFPWGDDWLFYVSAEGLQSFKKPTVGANVLSVGMVVNLGELP